MGSRRLRRRSIRRAYGGRKGRNAYGGRKGRSAELESSPVGVGLDSRQPPEERDLRVGRTGRKPVSHLEDVVVGPRGTSRVLNLPRYGSSKKY